MQKLFKIVGMSLLTLILLLIPLFGVYIASAQALPGEGRYPLKTQSESIIDSLSTVYPSFYAYFSLLKSERRYQEVIGLTAKNQDISLSNQQFLTQIRQTLFDIQSVGEISLRLNYIAQYQSFLTNAKENLSYKAVELKDQLGVDRTKSIKTFTVDEFGVEQGRLIAKKKVLEQKGVTQKDPVSEALLIKNIQQLELAQTSIQSLIQK